MTGRCIAYFGPDDIETEIKSKLQALGFQRVGLRAGRLWGGEAESWATHIWAPGYPGIVRCYVDAVHAKEVSDMADAGQRIRPPERLRSLPSASVITIVSAGPHAQEALTKYGTSGTVLAVNHANRICEPDWHLANDGFVGHPDATEGIRICRLTHAHTVPAGPWFALDDVFDAGSELSSLVAIRLAIWCKPKRLRIIGHDCCMGQAISPKSNGWDEQRLTSLRSQTAALLKQANESGIVTTWYRQIDNQWQEIKGRAHKL
jgi:hypothetical protein